MGAQLDYRWRLREVMAARGLWQTTELVPLLAERGVTLSAVQVYRLVVHTPERLSLKTLMALCDALECTSVDLIEPAEAETVPVRRRASGSGTIDAAAARPKRARISPGP